MQQYQKGLVTAESIDDFIDQWHNSDIEQILPAFLGMSSEQYFRWLKNPAALPEIVKPFSKLNPLTK